jgi:hypothetical protein
LKDRNIIRDMDPPARQSYLRHLAAATAAAEPVNSRRRPFARHFTIAPADYEGGKLSPVAPDEIKEIAMTMMGDDDLAAVVSLDKAINGTSLMPKFEFGSAFLIPPGTPSGHLECCPATTLAESWPPAPTFDRVGHHGSHNATPGRIPGRRAANEHPDVGRRRLGAPSAGVAGEIPPETLLAQLHKRAKRVILSDHAGPAPAGTQVRPEIGINFRSPAEGGATWPNGHAAVRDGWSTPPPWAPACSRSPVATSFALQSLPIPTTRLR